MPFIYYYRNNITSIRFTLTNYRHFISKNDKTIDKFFQNGKIKVMCHMLFLLIYGKNITITVGV